LYIVPLTQQYLASLTCKKISFVRRHIKRNSNIRNSGQFITEVQYYAVYILDPGGPFTLGGRTSDIYCTGSPVGPTDLVGMTKTKKCSQQISFKFQNLSSKRSPPQLGHFTVMLWEQLSYSLSKEVRLLCYQLSCHNC